MKYSVEDIDQLRKLVKRGLEPANYFGAANSVEHAAMRQAWDHAVEERLRTYMLNGTTVAELEAQLA